ncbi:complement C1q tumor necrosis factor-related protein 3-like [Littorina saxatilis]|uniref:C1q domain-containing protein n=1 Tax=Littorina saxatilis TaxID=31220 RepID=A0AAN9BVA9_9CAEN
MMTSFVVFLVSAVGLLISAVALPTTSPSSTSKRSDALATLQNAVIKQWQLITQMQSKIATLESRLGKDRPVAFMVSVPYNQDLNVNQRVGFGTPELNVGGGFRTATDSFVAPVSGIYVLFLKVMGQIGTHYTNYMTFQLKKDNAVIAETETNDNDNSDRSSVQVIVHLTKGQSVWVVKSGGTGRTIFGGGVVSTLGGFLLRAD